MKYWIKILLSSFVFIALLFFIYFNLNRADYYSKVGQFYIKKSNYTKAQEYLEKSYKLGNTDTDFRISYVNTLVNSPLTLQAQEALVRIAEDSIQDSASASAEYFLRNLKKEINNKYRDNYVKQAPFSGKIMHWGKIPITYSFQKTKDVPKTLLNAVNDAFDAWERASSARIRFERISGDNADIIVNFAAKQIEQAEYGQKYAIAYTTPYYTQDKLEKMDMEFSTLDVDGKEFTPNQMYNTALHEVFHALGFMGHSFEINHIMYIAKDRETITNDTRKELTDEDKITLELLYKIKPDITNAEDLKYDYIPYIVLGDNYEINDTKADEAKNYIRKAPNIPAGYIDLAQALLNQQKYTPAISYLEKALRLAQDDLTKYMVYYNLAVANYYDGNYELAHIYLNKAKEYKDDNELHVLNAELYLKEEQFAECIKEYNKLIEENPNNLEYTLHLTNLYIKRKQYLKARQNLKRFINNNPSQKNNERLKPYKILFL